MPGIGPRPYHYRFLPSTKTETAGSTVAISAESSVIARPSTYDCYLRDIDGSSPFTLLFAGNVLGADFPFAGADDEGEVLRLEKARRSKRVVQESFNDEWLSEGIVLLAPINTDLLFFYNPDDAGELRRVKGALRRNSWRSRSEIPLDVPNSILGAPALVYQVRVRDVLSEIQYHLLEPTIDGGLTWQFWSFNEVFNYLRERIARFLLETGLIRDRSSLTLAAAISTYDLDPTLVDLYRVYGETGVLARTDRWTLDNTRVGWASELGTPRVYVEDPLNPLSAQFVPAPSGTGTVKYHYIKQTPLALPAEGTAENGFVDYALRIPNLFAWAIKYGVMADMLSRQGEGNDPKRAAYCEQRFEDGVDLAMLFLGEKARKG